MSEYLLTSEDTTTIYLELQNWLEPWKTALDVTYPFTGMMLGSLARLAEEERVGSIGTSTCSRAFFLSFTFESKSDGNV